MCLWLLESGIEWEVMKSHCWLPVFKRICTKKEKEYNIAKDKNIAQTCTNNINKAKSLCEPKLENMLKTKKDLFHFLSTYETKSTKIGKVTAWIRWYSIIKWQKVNKMTNFYFSSSFSIKESGLQLEKVGEMWFKRSF